MARLLVPRCQHVSHLRILSIGIAEGFASRPFRRKSPLDHSRSRLLIPMQRTLMSGRLASFRCLPPQEEALLSTRGLTSCLSLDQVFSFIAAAISIAFMFEARVVWS